MSINISSYLLESFYNIVILVFPNMPHSEKMSAIKLIPQCGTASGQTSGLLPCTYGDWVAGSRPESAT